MILEIFIYISLYLITLASAVLLTRKTNRLEGRIQVLENAIDVLNDSIMFLRHDIQKLSRQRDHVKVKESE